MPRSSVFNLRVVSILIWILAWFISAQMQLVSARILPSPQVVLVTFISDLRSGALLFHSLTTVSRALFGFGLAIPAGVLLGAAMARSSIVDSLLEPTILVTYPVPKIALFPILTFVFGLGSGSKIAFAFLECLYPITVATMFAVRGINFRLIWAAQSMGAGRARILSRVLLPAAVPGIFTGLRIALPTAVIVIIITEMLGDTRGLGYYIADASASFSSDRVYAGIVAVGACGYLLDRALTTVRKRVLHIH